MTKTDVRLERPELIRVYQCSTCAMIDSNQSQINDRYRRFKSAPKKRGRSRPPPGGPGRTYSAPAPKARMKPAPADSDELAALRTENAELRESVNELSVALTETLADNESMARVFEANDQIAAASPLRIAGATSLAHLRF